MTTATAEKIFFESGHAKPHKYLYGQIRRGEAVNMENNKVQSPEDNAPQPKEQIEVITTVQGKYGLITIKTDKTFRKTTGEDIHNLIARILIKKRELQNETVG